MPVSLEFLRGVAGFIGVGCAYMLGRSVALYGKGRQKQSRLYAWAFRTALCMIGVALRNRVDAADIVIWMLCGIAYALAYRNHSREKIEEDLTSTMFPHDE